MKSLENLISDSIYTELEVKGHKGFILKANNQSMFPNCPWVWYAPTLMNNSPGKDNIWMFSKLLDAGLPICGVDVGESYGSPNGRKIFTEFYKKIINEYSFSSKPRLLPQSRGGLMLYMWASENPACIECISGIFPVGDINSYPGVDKACSAYGMTEPELNSCIELHNPIDCLEPLARRGIPILHIHGDQDILVPLEKNSAELDRRYCALGGSMKVIIVHGKGHEVCPDFFQSQELIDFLLSGGHFK